MSVGDVPTVFIIDDDAGVRASIQDLVESVGLRAESFATAQKFLSHVQRDGPSCLVLDVRLPDTSGLDLQQKLSRAGLRIPIIFITGYADIPMTVRAMKSGAVEFLTKHSKLGRRLRAELAPRNLPLGERCRQVLVRQLYTPKFHDGPEHCGKVLVQSVIRHEEVGNPTTDADAH